MTMHENNAHIDSIKMISSDRKFFNFLLDNVGQILKFDSHIYVYDYSKGKSVRQENKLFLLLEVTTLDIKFHKVAGFTRKDDNLSQLVELDTFIYVRVFFDNSQSWIKLFYNSSIVTLEKNH